MKNRESWIDLAKCIGIFLVVLWHYNMGNKTYTYFIYSFHMPLFFIISGYLFHMPTDNKYSKYLKNNVKSLLVPYLIFGLFSIMYVASSQYLKTQDIQDWFIMKSLGGLFLGIAHNTEYTIMNYVALWFLPALFVVRQIYYFICRFKAYKKVIICILGITIAGIFKYYGYLMPFSIGAALSALPFFFFGNFLSSSKYMDYLNKGKKQFIVVLIISLVTLCVSFHFSSGMTDIASSSTTNNLFLYLLMGISGSLMVFSFCFLLNNIKLNFIQTVSEGTLLIMCIHGYCYGVVSMMYKCLGITEYYSLCGGCWTVLIIIAMAYYPIIFCKKHLPLLLGKNTKKLTKISTL
ncbi:MAG: acyltransferase family protein [Flavobacteriales bacterium]|nr:acyltransferase family protein [Flavobacteriales bacterium]